MLLSAEYENSERDGRLYGLDGVDLRPLGRHVLAVRRKKPAQVRPGQDECPWLWMPGGGDKPSTRGSPWEKRDRGVPIGGIVDSPVERWIGRRGQEGWVELAHQEPLASLGRPLGLRRMLEAAGLRVLRGMFWPNL